MKGAPTLKIRISDTKDPEVLLCTMRWGNLWSRAKLRKPGGWSGMDRVNLGLRHQRVVWIGERCNVPIARQIYVVATRAARRAWEDRRKKDREEAKEYRRLRRRWRQVCFGSFPLTPPRLATTGPDARKRFMIGFFASIGRTLEARPLRNDRDRLAAERAAAFAKIDEMRINGDVVDVKNNTGRSNPFAELAGYEEGRKVSLNRPVSGAARATPLLENAKEAAHA